MTWEQAEASILASLDNVLDNSVTELTQNIKMEAPVDTGKSKAGYQKITVSNGYAMINQVFAPDGFNYVEQLWFGWSQQLPQGHYPTLIKFKVKLMYDLETMNL